MPLLQVGAACCTVVLQSLPQKLQFFASEAKVVSQPLDALPSQSPLPCGQLETWHVPLLHTQSVEPLAEEQSLPQLPQLWGSLAVFTSQPSLGSLLQSLNPGLQLWMSHWPLAAQPATALDRSHGAQDGPAQPKDGSSSGGQLLPQNFWPGLGKQVGWPPLPATPPLPGAPASPPSCE